MMMMKRALALLTSFTTASMAASLTRVTNFGSNPTAMNMYLYRPDNAPTNAPVVVACHPCGGNAQSYFTQTNLKPYADQYGFILVYPEAPHDSNCFETSTTRTQTHNGGGDSYTIVQMVNYTLSTYSADRSRVYALGQSSGGMITNILMGSYPDVFAAGSPNSAFPFACLTGGGSSSPGGNLTCAQGGVIHTGQEWAQLVYNAYPGYTGRRPTVQLWHGTADSLVKIQCLTEEIKQWSTVLNVTFTRNVTNSPSSGYTEMIYGDGSKLRAYIQQGGAHFTPLNEKTVLTNWGLLGGGPSTGSSSSSTSISVSTTSSSTSTQGGCTVAKYGQCGGLNYSGCKTCAAGSTCVYSNDWYSQCL